MKHNEITIIYNSNIKIKNNNNNNKIMIGNGNLSWCKPGVLDGSNFGGKKYVGSSHAPRFTRKKRNQNYKNTNYKWN